MADDVVMQRRPSLAGRMHKMIPVLVFSIADLVLVGFSQPAF